MKLITLSHGYFAEIDDEDFDLVSMFKWRSKIKSRTDGTLRIYAYRRGPRIGGKRKTIFLHRFIMNAQDGTSIDHIDGNPLNNSRMNLRFCTNSENQRNRIAQLGSSKFKGVNWNSRDSRWVSQIRIDGKRKHLGYFVNEQEAANAYDCAARKYFGEFARPNLTKAWEVGE